MTRAPDTFIVSGISRSGTSLLTVLLNELPNTVCFNETLALDVDDLPGEVSFVRDRLVRGAPVENKCDARGRLATDTLSDDVKRAPWRVDKPLDARVLIGSNRNLTYLNKLTRIVELGYRTIVMVRDPVFTIASWSSSRARQFEIPGFQVGSGDLHPHLRDVHISEQDPIARRAEVWEHYANRIWEHRGLIHILPYEWLCSRPMLALANLAELLGRDYPTTLDLSWIDPPRNAEDRYRELGSLRDTVTRLCPTRRCFGYA